VRNHAAHATEFFELSEHDWSPLARASGAGVHRLAAAFAAKMTQINPERVRFIWFGSVIYNRLLIAALFPDETPEQRGNKEDAQWRAILDALGEKLDEMAERHRANATVSYPDPPRASGQARRRSMRRRRRPNG
jgi:hypothetical protein